MDHIRGTVLVLDVQIHRPLALLPAIRHADALLDSTSPRKRHHLEPQNTDLTKYRHQKIVVTQGQSLRQRRGRIDGQAAEEGARVPEPLHHDRAAEA